MIPYLLENTLPENRNYRDRASLDGDILFHNEHFNMPAWTHLMENLVNEAQYDSLQAALDWHVAHGYSSVEGLRHMRYHYDCPHNRMTMNCIFQNLCEIVKRARSFKNRKAWLIKKPEVDSESEQSYIKERL